MASTPLTYHIVDAFTDRPFAGNPAAVMVLNSWPSDSWLQNVAMEMNLSETAFLVPIAEGYHLRWFTPNTEVDLCGHATLASAKVLAATGKLAPGGMVNFSTRSGILTAIRDSQKFQLDFPVKPARPVTPPVGLIESLQVSPLWVGRNDFDYLIEVASETDVRDLRPDFQLMGSIPCRGVIVTTQGNIPGIDFVSRFFAPAAGVNEDPVTGSAHCCLADFWSKRLGKTVMSGMQLSARGGKVDVELRGERVFLIGEAVIFARGEFVTESQKTD